MTETPSDTKSVWTEPGRLLADARKQMVRLTKWPEPEPQTETDAYAIQQALVEHYAEPLAGWKIGGTSELARSILGTPTPIYGPIPKTRLFHSGASVPMGVDSLRGIETEVAVSLRQDFHSRDTPYTVDEIRTAIDRVFPAIELITLRGPGELTAGGMRVIADCSASDALVIGEGRVYEGQFDLRALRLTTQMAQGDPISGLSDRAYGGPDIALTWFVNALTKRGNSLRVGDVITTGLITDLLFAEPGNTIETHSDDLGSVQLVVE